MAILPKTGELWWIDDPVRHPPSGGDVATGTEELDPYGRILSLIRGLSIPNRITPFTEEVERLFIGVETPHLTWDILPATTFRIFLPPWLWRGHSYRQAAFARIAGQIAQHAKSLQGGKE